MAIKLTHLGQVVQKMSGPRETVVLVCYVSAGQWILVTRIFRSMGINNTIEARNV